MIVHILPDPHEGHPDNTGYDEGQIFLQVNREELFVLARLVGRITPSNLVMGIWSSILDSHIFPPHELMGDPLPMNLGGKQEGYSQGELLQWCAKFKELGLDILKLDKSWEISLKYYKKD